MDIIVGLALHWPCITDNSVLNDLCQGDEHPSYTPMAFTFTFKTFTQCRPFENILPTEKNPATIC